MDEVSPVTLPTDKILAHKQSGVGWLTFNQPEKRNAISLAMWDAIAMAVDAFAADPAVRVVVMKGAGGKAFVSGADISEFEKVRNDAEAQREYTRRTSAAGERLAMLDRPLIAMIRGFCIGGGMAMAMRADLRVASSDSRFGIPAARLGIAYNQTSIERLLALVGPAKAKEILFLGRHYTAAEALEMRFVNAVVAPEELESTVVAMAGEIVRNAPLSIRASKATIDQLTGDPSRRDPARIEALERACFDSADYAEGRRAFMEKRPPLFIGR
ncbi:MAG: enoyl-CoA hydratase/isomerase family protein [Proteobacteria bacterium]|nr:enoyl-CoA hydratase/isomerase family protein [Pseudomonadota bacterium]